MADLPISVRTPAKVNLTLAILDRRPDGFHEIESWAIPIGLFDELRIFPAPSMSLEVINGDLPADESNLVWRAATALAEAAGIIAAARIELRKAIPIGAGLGGGSSDAAATLLALNDLWSLDWPIDRLSPIAASIGSDVPFFLHPRSAILRGRGEQVEVLDAPWHGWLCVVVPPYGLATVDIYRAFDEMGTGPRCPLPRPWRAVPESSNALSPLLFNDLEPAAFARQPRLVDLHSRINGLDGRLVRMTGSGSALFAIFDSQEQATAWASAARVPAGSDHRIYVGKSL